MYTSFLRIAQSNAEMVVIPSKQRKNLERSLYLVALYVSPHFQHVLAQAKTNVAA